MFWLVFCLVWGLLVFLDDLGTPPTWRPHSWKKKVLDLPPLAPPVTVYANLPAEWPLARISVYMRHVSVLLRVPLKRRLAELSFKGVDFQHLHREVVRHTKEDFDTICGAVASQLAALFAFLKPSQDRLPGTDRDDLALYADPTYWLYGLLSFCAKSCEAKTTETGGEPDFKTSKA